MTLKDEAPRTTEQRFPLTAALIPLLEPAECPCLENFFGSAITSKTQKYLLTPVRKYRTIEPLALEVVI
jgi:hypothetical protein